MSAVTSHVDDYPMKNLPSKAMTVQYQDPESRGDSKSNRDEIELAHFGKRQQLKVGPLHDARRYQNSWTIWLTSSCGNRGVSVWCPSLDLHVP